MARGAQSNSLIPSTSNTTSFETHQVGSIITTTTTNITTNNFINKPS
jgi:hypothetical protein